MKSAYVESAKKVIDCRKKNKNKEKVSKRTWTKIEKRRKLKEKLLNTKSPRLQEQVQSAYKNKD